MEKLHKNGSNGAATSNGKGTPTANLVVVKSEVKAEPQTAKVDPPQVTPPAPALTLQSQRDKSEKLTILFEKEERLATTRRELERFKLGTEEGTNQLELKDMKGGNPFRTCHPVLIKIVMRDVMAQITEMEETLAAEIIAIG